MIRAAVGGRSPHPHASFGVLWPGVVDGVALASLSLQLDFGFGLGWLGLFLFCLV